MGSLQDTQVVNESAHCNSAQLNVTEDGTVIVPTLNWADFFAPHLKKINGIKQYHHLRFPSSEPGVVYARLSSDSEEDKFALLKNDTWHPEPSSLPSQITPKGLSNERQWYLFNKIREFCPEEARDLTCPEPNVPQPTSRAGTPVADSTIPASRPRSRTGTSADSSTLPPTKRVGCAKPARRRDTTAEHAQTKQNNQPLIDFYNTLDLSGKFFLVSTSLLVADYLFWQVEGVCTCFKSQFRCISLTSLSSPPSPP